MHLMHLTCGARLVSTVAWELWAPHDPGADWARSSDTGCCVVLPGELITSLEGSTVHFNKMGITFLPSEGGESLCWTHEGQRLSVRL